MVTYLFAHESGSPYQMLEKVNLKLKNVVVVQSNASNPRSVTMFNLDFDYVMCMGIDCQPNTTIMIVTLTQSIKWNKYSRARIGDQV
jgi:hypothetical protein